jgi:hypothetical protein
MDLKFSNQAVSHLFQQIIAERKIEAEQALDILQSRISLLEPCSFEHGQIQQNILKLENYYSALHDILDFERES